LLVTPMYNVPLRLLARIYTAGCLSITTYLDSRLRGNDEKAEYD
jgi:hypothetical protein